MPDEPQENFEPPTQLDLFGDDSGRGRKRRTAVGTGGEPHFDRSQLLARIGQQPGVVGSLVVERDGIVSASTMPANIDGTIVGVMALSIYRNTEYAMKKLGQDHIYEIVSRTARGYMVIADLGPNLLLTITDVEHVDEIISLMRTIVSNIAA